MPRKPDMNCAECGNPMWSGGLPQGQARCRSCRRNRPAPRDRHTIRCEECGSDFQRATRRYRFCSGVCTGRWHSRRMQIRSLDDPRTQRTARENAAPGLTRNQRDKLRAKWKQQQKPCAYCGARADTIDHVLPLVRGGTNYEGNLAPACRRCNSSKSGRTVIEWRTGCVLPRAIGKPNWELKPKQPALVKPQREPHPCPMCQTQTMRLKYCTAECGVERQRRYMRDKYRAKHGLNVDASRPTARWAA